MSSAPGAQVEDAGEATPHGREAGVEMVVTSQLSQWWLYGTLALLAVGALFRNPLLFSMGLLLGSALLVAWGWFRLCLVNLTVERRFSQTRAFWGETVEMEQVFTNDKALPLPWLSVVDEYPTNLRIDSPAAAYSHRPRRKGLKTSLSLGWYERVTRRYPVECLARGEHEFGPIEIESGDIFGLFRRIASITTPKPLLIYPRYVPVDRLGLPARQAFGDFKSIQQLVTDPLRFKSVREYAYGDNPRHIHWSATARRGALQTKLFEPSATPQLYIFCNQDTFAKVWEGLDTDTLELTITVAASLANHALQEGYMVGLQVNTYSRDSDRQVKLPPGRAPDQFTRILEALARVQGWSGLAMEDLIRAERRALPVGATLVVVTGLVTDDLLGVLLALRRAGHPVTLVETVATERGSRMQVTKGISAEGFASQGITYYLVDALGTGVAALEELALDR